MVEMAWMAAGGFLGAIARHVIQSHVSSRRTSKWPLGTLIVNVSGSFLLGWIAASPIFEPMALFLGTGFMGAFTTFSTLKLESVTLFRRGEGRTGLLYLGLTYLAGMGAAWLGFLIGR
ncbi:fluoride efflux transporter FluC [Staphylospora marina]|uniref:fluoride efflux transporter FluC n=1 Tax=Staphylospora marina TaxID=2490858 RepID=UPI000F5C0E43|nr:CrcB family protein [Staphylospora marina]